MVPPPMPMMRMSRYWRSISDSVMYPMPPNNWTRLVGHPLAGLDGGVLGEAHLGDQVGLAGQLPLDHVVGVDAGDVDPAGHLGQRVLHRLAGDQRPAERLAVAAPLHGEVQAALRARIRLRGKGDALG